MRAAVMRDSKLVVDDVPNPEPGPGEVLVKTLAKLGIPAIPNWNQFLFLFMIKLSWKPQLDGVERAICHVA